MMSFRTLLPLTLAISLATTPVAAAPASKGTPKGAPVGFEAKFKAVVEAEANEEYEKALTLLDEIPAEKHNVYTRLKRATLLVRLGRFIEAEEILSALLKDPKADAIRATVQGDLDDLRARMPKLTVRMSASSKADAWVTVDDKPVGPPVTIPLNPGTHVIVAKRNAVEVFRQKVTLQDSQTLEVEIDTSIAPPVGSVSAAKPPVSPASSVAPHAADVGGSGDRMGGTLFFIGGGVLVVGSVASFLLAKSAQGDLESNCASQKTLKCDTDAAGAPRVHTWETIGWVSGGLALAALGVGVGLTVRSRDNKTATVTPMVGSTMGLSIAGSF